MLKSVDIIKHIEDEMPIENKQEPRLCRCIDPPKGESFVKGEVYKWDYGLDALMCVYNRDGRCWPTNDIEFFWYFQIISGKVY